MRLLPYGPTAFLVELDDLDTVMASSEQWRDAQIPGVLEVVPAARTVLVVHDGSLDPSRLVPVSGRPRPVHTAQIEIPVRYDGPDLEGVAVAAGLDVASVVELHTSVIHRVAFCGFVPGFAYLVGLPERLHLPRRSTPRERVPSGAVAVADGFSAVYPRSTPGGWHLLGRTDLVMWDERRDPPALLAPGSEVRFTAR